MKYFVMLSTEIFFSALLLGTTAPQTPKKLPLAVIEALCIPAHDTSYEQLQQHHVNHASFISRYTLPLLLSTVTIWACYATSIRLIGTWGTHTLLQLVYNAVRRLCRSLLC